MSPKPLKNVILRLKIVTFKRFYPHFNFLACTTLIMIYTNLTAARPPVADTGTSRSPAFDLTTFVCVGASGADLTLGSCAKQNMIRVHAFIRSLRRTTALSGNLQLAHQR